jgi:hypothetical protein
VWANGLITKLNTNAITKKRKEEVLYTVTKERVNENKKYFDH